MCRSCDAALSGATAPPGAIAPVSVPFVSTRHALRTKEWTPLEPNVLDNKYYVRGIGTVREVAVKGPVERLELVSFAR